MGWFSRKIKVQPPYDTLSVEQQRALYFLLEYFGQFATVDLWGVGINSIKSDAINYLKKASFNSSDVDDLQIPAQADDDDTRIDILQQIFALPTRYKTVVILYYYNDYSVEEIAKILKISKSAVKMRLKRSRDLLKIQLEDYDNE